MEVVPYKETKDTKKNQVARMFNNISRKYDLLNHLLSLGIDIYWRKQAIKILKPEKPRTILDVATGTADFAIEAAKVGPDKIIGVDIADKMLELGRIKIEKKGLSALIELKTGDSEKLDFPDNKFEAVIVSFGVRNFENLEKGLSDIYRVLDKNGTLVVLEFSKPTVFPLKQLYQFYFRFILPLIGKLISKDQSAYSYLPESVNAFPDGHSFVAILQKIGFKKTQWKSLTFGISSIYVGKK